MRLVLCSQNRQKLKIYYILRNCSVLVMLFTGQNGFADGRGALNLKIHPQGLLSISFMFQPLAVSVGKFSKKCFAFSNSIILSNYRPLTTFILSFHPWARLRGLRYCAITQYAGYGRTRRDLVYADLTTCTTCNMICCTRTVADPGEGPSPPPPYF